MESIQGFLNRHTLEVVQKAFEEKQQSVELLTNGNTVGEFMIIDAPEYDFMWHRCTIHVDISLVMPTLRGQLRITWPDSKVDRVEFNENKPFGDALEHLQNFIWNRIAED